MIQTGRSLEDKAVLKEGTEKNCEVNTDRHFETKQIRLQRDWEGGGRWKGEWGGIEMVGAVEDYGNAEGGEAGGAAHNASPVRPPPPLPPASCWGRPLTLLYGGVYGREGEAEIEGAWGARCGGQREMCSANGEF